MRKGKLRVHYEVPVWFLFRFCLLEMLRMKIDISRQLDMFIWAHRS